MDLVHILTMFAIYVLLVSSLNLLLGYGGMVSLCQAVFYGVGAYCTAVLTTRWGVPPMLAPLGSVLGGAICAITLGWLTMPFHGDRFVLLTISFQIIATALFLNVTPLTGGTKGISGIPSPAFFGSQSIQTYSQLGMSVVIASLGLMLLQRIHRSPYRRALSAVRDDELAASSIGKSAQYYRFSAFLIAGMLSAAAGSLYAVSISLVDPTSFTLDESIFILMALSIGGSGNLVGPLVGTAVAVLLPEVLRLVPIEAGHAANIRQIIYGLLLILIIRLRPKGIAGVYDLS